MELKGHVKVYYNIIPEKYYSWQVAIFLFSLEI